MSIAPPNVPQSIIAGGKPAVDVLSNEEHFSRPDKRYRLVKNPDSGEVALMTQENANDMIRLNGWQYASMKAISPELAKELLVNEKSRKKLLSSKTLSQSEIDRIIPRAPVEPVAEVAAAVTEDMASTEDYVEPTPALDAARARYAELTGKDADKRWGKKKLDEKIAAAFAAKQDAEDDD